uniref:myelin transcription factor 1-like protein n=1 Tax=Myxine glutinosa TaxID=7769 RepID=UPI00358F2371
MSYCSCTQYSCENGSQHAGKLSRHRSSYNCPLGRKRRSMDKASSTPPGKRRYRLLKLNGSSTEEFFEVEDEISEERDEGSGREENQDGHRDEDGKSESRADGASRFSYEDGDTVTEQPLLAVSHLEADRDDNNNDEYGNYEELVAKSLLNLGKIAEEVANSASRDTARCGATGSSSNEQTDDDDDDDSSDSGWRSRNRLTPLEGVREAERPRRPDEMSQVAEPPPPPPPPPPLLLMEERENNRDESDDTVCLSSLECLRNQCYDLARKLSDIPQR